MRRMRSLLCAIAVLALVGCATYDDPMASSSTLAGGFGDSDTAAILIAVNEGEVQQGNFATTRASSPAVRSFAEMLVTDHTNALGKWRDLTSRLNITPAENATSTQLRNGSQQTINALSTYTGSAFDRTFMQGQVDGHQWVLNTIDSLLPTASPATRDLLMTQRTSVVRHLDRAREIRNGL